MQVVEAIKKIYPTIQGGFVYWETKPTGEEWNHPSEGLIWENQDFTKPAWELIEAQFNTIILEEAKGVKIQEIKTARDAANLADMVDHQAIELIEQDGEWVEGELVYFTFQVKATNNPATEPSTILLATVMQGTVNPAYFLRYSCKIGDRKGYVKLNAAVASSLMNHAKIRNENNIKHCNDLEIEIANATTIEQVNAISF